MLLCSDCGKPAQGLMFFYYHDGTPIHLFLECDVCGSRFAEADHELYDQLSDEEYQEQRPPADYFHVEDQALLERAAAHKYDPHTAYDMVGGNLWDS